MRFIKSSGIFFIGSVLSKAISFFMLPLYTSYIPTRDMGYYDLSLTYITIATSFLFFDIWVATLRYMYDENDENKQATSIKSGIFIFMVSSIVFLFLGIIFSFSFSFESIYLIILYGIFQNIANLFGFCVRGIRKNREFAISGIINTLVNVVFNFFLIVKKDMGYEALYLSAIIGFIFQSGYLLFYGKIYILLLHGKYDCKLAKEMFKYSLPLCLNSIAYWILTSLNRIVLNKIYGNEANGIYAIGNKFSFIIGLITTCFLYAWQDVSFSKSKEKNRGIFYSKASNLYIKFLLGCTFFILPVIKIFFPLLVNKNYYEAEKTIPLFLMVATISAISTFIGNIFYAIKETKTIFISMVISAFFNSVFCYPMIRIFGINGANITVLISFIMNIIIRWYVLKKKISFSLESNLILFIIPLLVSFTIFLKFNIKVNAVFLLMNMIFGIICSRKYLKTIKNLFKER
ncbi:MAG: oligosaccharide flippase family protein [Fusobacterium sp.]|uniref:lipopolysaccharide biosynthesis protein n=1 Tax=Fusobacterium sp. TaxID=68766 RepID=UPI002A74809E|nr:oligosaccharide flippase family protein [Fusobacterium sp.]MDY2980501.1 oligosaccharide flippase family protein [Fusobacterium sp.]